MRDGMRDDDVTAAGRDSDPGLDLRYYKMAFDVLEDCDGARSLHELKERLVTSLGRTYRVASTTFFVGQSVSLACLDPNPVIVGVTRSMLPEYQEVWQRHDLFASADTAPALRASRVASLSEATSLSASPKHYVSDYLLRHDIQCAAAISLDISGDRTALVGLFDRDRHRLGDGELASLRLLAKPLSRLAGAVPDDVRPSRALPRLTPRHAEVVRLVGEGLSNRAIAVRLSVNEDTVKKYVSRILAESGCRNRTELALLFRGNAG